jgi:elongation factor G
VVLSCGCGRDGVDRFRPDVAVGQRVVDIPPNMTTDERVRWIAARVLAARRGHVVDSSVRAGTAVVTATVPLAELFGYANRLRSRTQGRGTFIARPTGYAPAPPG